MKPSGRFTVTFATLETCLDAICVVIFNGYGGKNIKSRLPRHISTKLEFLSAASDLPALDSVSTELKTLISATTQLLDVRHFVVHGMFGEDENSQTVFAKPNMTVNNMHVVHLAATAETIDAQRKVVENLIGIAARMVLRLGTPP